MVAERGLSWSDKEGFLGLGDSEIFCGGFVEDDVSEVEELQEMASLFLVGLCLIGEVKKMGLFVSDFGIVKWTSRAVERLAAITRTQRALPG